MGRSEPASVQPPASATDRLAVLKRMGAARHHHRQLAAVGSALRPSAAFTSITSATAAAPAGTHAPLITDVRAARPVAAVDGSPLPDWGGRQGLGQICVAVDTGDGRTGFGVCGGGAPGIIIIETVIRPTIRYRLCYTNILPPCAFEGLLGGRVRCAVCGARCGRS